MIKIEVTGNSIAEVADKLLAIGGSLRATPTVFEHEYKHQTITLSATKPEVAAAPVVEEAVVEEVEVAEAAPANPTPSSSPDTKSDTKQSSAPKTPPASASDEIDFNTEVTPRVVKVVATCGKPAMAGILEQFGVAKASHLDPSRLPELIVAMDDAIAGAA